MQAKICDETALKLHGRRKKSVLSQKNDLVDIMNDSIIDWVITTYDHFETGKGQLISQCPFGVIVWTKIPTIFFQDFCPRL